MKTPLKCLLAMFGFALICPQLASAQNTGGVFPPTVNDGHKSAQYRITLSDDDRSAQRVHYQQAINGDFMWRLLGQVKTNDGDTDFDFVQAELFWDFSETGDSHAQGVRFDLRYRDDDRPAQFGLNWMHQFKLSETWSARALALSSAQFGSNPADGIALQTRGNVMYKASGGVTLGGELYSNWGRTGNLRSLDESGQQAGPFVSVPVGEKTALYLNALVGLTDTTPDTELRLWLTQNF